MTRQNSRATDVAAYAAANGFRLLCRGDAFHVIDGDELGCSGDIESVAQWLSHAVRKKSEARLLA